MNEKTDESVTTQIVRLLPFEEQFGFPVVMAFEAAKGVMFRTLFDDLVTIRDA